MPWWVVGLSLFAASISSTTLIGQSGDAYDTGLAVFNYNLTGIVVMVFFAVFLLPLYIRSKVFTIPEFLEKRFDKRSRYYFSAICIIGNILPIPFILLFIKKIFQWMKKIKCFRGLIEKLENRAMGRSEKIQQYEFWGLVLFVGIPLPGTGAWTGALIASLLGIDIKKSSLAILCGIAMATVIMYVVSYVLVGNIVS